MTTLKTYYIQTGSHRVMVEASDHKAAIDDAFEQITDDGRAMGRIFLCSVHGFDSDAGDDLLGDTVAALRNIGFTENADGLLVRCKTCKGVGRIDCCEEINCPECEGLFTKDCPDCPNLAKHEATRE